MSARTPGPWQVKGNSGTFYIDAPGTGMIAAIRYLGNEPTPLARERGNAAFIVHACNNHDALVEALRRLMVVVRAEHGVNGRLTDDTERAFREARAALRACGGE